MYLYLSSLLTTHTHSLFKGETMKQSLLASALLLLILLLISSKISARFITTKQGKKEVKFNKIANEKSLLEKDSSEFINLLGLELCDDGDDECFNRRILSEAHLDYIYTQHHKP
ncbi:PSK domain-containing protein [Cephalotus follicularis]|uniref:Phytosulfokine n=1 Tax=Cephalotus follicularis TaxID=3775 RepID=A0A1Q3B1C0_CEPFO|nr:PSK domain-containing protein [Cephalotus follicularis]